MNMFKRVELSPSEKEGLFVYISDVLADTGYFEEDTRESIMDGIDKRMEDEDVIDEYMDSEYINFFEFMKGYILEILYI